MFFPGGEFDQLYFTTTTEKATGEKKSEITGMKKGDIWFATKTNAANGTPRTGSR